MPLLTKKDWPRLQWSVIIFVVLVAAGAAVVFLAMKSMDDARKAQMSAVSERETARAKVARADEEARTLREKITVYEALLARGIIGQEHRLDWIERIRKIKEGRKLIEVNYELGPQQAISANVVVPNGNTFDIMASPMKLQMSLLHENDLLGFVADLRGSIKGYLRVNLCDIERVPPVPPGNGPAPQLKASCEIDWITVREKT